MWNFFIRSALNCIFFCTRCYILLLFISFILFSSNTYANLFGVHQGHYENSYKSQCQVKIFPTFSKAPQLSLSFKVFDKKNRSIQVFQVHPNIFFDQLNKSNKVTLNNYGDDTIWFPAKNYHLDLFFLPDRSLSSFIFFRSRGDKGALKKVFKCIDLIFEEEI